VSVEAYFWSRALENEIQRSRASKVTIAPTWPGDSIRFLERFRDQLSGLVVEAEKVRDAAVVGTLTNLRELRLATAVHGLDFSQLADLEVLSLRRQKALGNVEACHGLEELSLSGVPVRTLAPLGTLRNLRRLVLRRIQSLPAVEGVQALPLRSLLLVDLRRLSSLAPVAHISGLREFEIAACRQIRDADVIGRMLELRRLRCDHGPALSSFEVFRGLKHLEDLEIWGTHFRERVLSIEPLIHLRRLRTLHLAGGIRAVSDIEHVGEITSLRNLRIEGAPGFASLEYPRPLRNLQRFSLWKTPFGDGDLTALLDLPNLRKIEGIDPYLNHHSHSDDELNGLLEARNRRRRRVDPRHLAPSGEHFINRYSR
jgi:hypothetical protein